MFWIEMMMNSRERQISKARKNITDKRLAAFLKAAAGFKDIVLATGLFDRQVNGGRTLDEIFYDGREFGFSLKVSPKSQNIYEIEFGCLAGPLAGDGGTWLVVFDDADIVISLESQSMWMS